MSDLFRVHCPGCGKRLRVPTAAVGQFAACPKCREQFLIPEPQPEPPAPPADGQSFPWREAESDLDDEPQYEADPGPGASQVGLALLICGRCGQTMQVDLADPEHVSGSLLACPGCGWRFSLHGGNDEPAPQSPDQHLQQMAGGYAPSAPRRRLVRRRPAVNAGIVVFGVVLLALLIFGAIAFIKSTRESNKPAAGQTRQREPALVGLSPALAAQLQSARKSVAATWGTQMRDVRNTPGVEDDVQLARQMLRAAQQPAGGDLALRCLLLAEGGRLMCIDPQNVKAAGQAIVQSMETITSVHRNLDPRAVPELGNALHEFKQRTGQDLLGSGDIKFFQQ